MNMIDIETAETRRAVQRMAQEARATTGPDRALAAASKSAWIESHGLARAGGRHSYCVCRLIGKGRGRDGHNCARVPGEDHTSLWLRDGAPVVFVFQPYSLSHRQLRELVAFADEHGLHLAVDTWPAWHYPGGVLQVELWRDPESHYWRPGDAA